jgi:hypothetical protein
MSTLRPDRQASRCPACRAGTVTTDDLVVGSDGGKRAQSVKGGPRARSPSVAPPRMPSAAAGAAGAASRRPTQLTSASVAAAGLAEQQGGAGELSPHCSLISHRCHWWAEHACRMHVFQFSGLLLQPNSVVASLLLPPAGKAPSEYARSEAGDPEARARSAHKGPGSVHHPRSEHGGDSQAKDGASSTGEWRGISCKVRSQC